MKREMSDLVGEKCEREWADFFVRSGFRVATYSDFNPRLKDADKGKQHGGPLAEGSVDLLVVCPKMGCHWVVQIKNGAEKAVEWLKIEERKVRGKFKRERGVIPVLVGLPPEQASFEAASQVLLRLEQDFYWHKRPKIVPSREDNPSFHALRVLATRLIEVEGFLQGVFRGSWSYAMIQRLIPQGCA